MKIPLKSKRDEIKLKKLINTIGYSWQRCFLWTPVIIEDHFVWLRFAERRLDEYSAHYWGRISWEYRL